MMNKKPFSSKSIISNETNCNNNVVSKLRRLKIEQNLLLQSLKKNDQKIYEVPESHTAIDIDCKKNKINYKDSYINIKNLFDDIKIITNTQELLAELEIDEIKKKVLELETTMRSFKLCLGTELSSLKSAEQELMNELEEMNFKDANNKKRSKISSASFKQAVPSPVRLLMTLPLKCIEVQEFQDFMKNSPNRYGGWNEYHHNIFVKIWQKHFGNLADTENNDSLAKEFELENFVEESLFKLQGINRRSLMCHVEWFRKYLLLRSKQQTAIEKWKSNRKFMRKVPDNNQVNCDVQNEVGNSRQPPKYITMKKKVEFTKPTKKIICKEDIERVMAPTKQWLSRCEIEEKREQIPILENVEKLRIPNWRQYL